MKSYTKVHPWKIIEKGFKAANNQICESLFSLGNGKMGQRGNFEEDFSGASLMGNYIAGVYYPDKTRVGWWKNGYPEYFAKVLNAANWVGIHVEVDSEILDLAKVKVSKFERVLNMKEAYLERTFQAEFKSGKKIEVKAKRFYSMVDKECAAMKYSVKALNFSGKIKITSYLDFDVVNQDSNYGEKFWEERTKKISKNTAYILARTKKTNFDVCAGISIAYEKNGKLSKAKLKWGNRVKYVEAKSTFSLKESDELTLYKYASITSSQNYKADEICLACEQNLQKASEKGFDKMLQEQAIEWKKIWDLSDVIVEGDDSAQQGIRFCIFHLKQTYTGDDDRLNIGPKGFTGEKYGGVTYWDTEAYCLPFYLSTSKNEVSRQLLVYRYKHLKKAIENAAKLGFEKGAALYPMVTINGEECHNEWEITFEEIHRNGAIAYAIFDYIRYTGDEKYLEEYGLEVLIGIARFWSQRVNWSKEKKKYVMLGVTGPNEFENNVNNNWYTNYIASWCLKYTIEGIEKLGKSNKKGLAKILKKTKFDQKPEIKRWKDIIAKMYYPYDSKLKIYLQQDGFLDKEIIKVADLPKSQLPIVHNWSWDRILRSCYIKQADTLQGMYFFEEDFTKAEIKKHFDFYEPLTVHESSLSPCVHSILASGLGYDKIAYEMYLRTARLDLDNYNDDSEDGCHITSMAGSWMSIVKGFGGMRIKKDHLFFDPMLPKKWKSYSFKIMFRDNLILVKVGKMQTEIVNEQGPKMEFFVANKKYVVEESGTCILN